MTNQNPLNQTLKLENGKNLGYTEFGDLSGISVIHFPGSGMSRLDGQHLHYEAKKRRIHLISVDRPGIGLSDYIKEYSILDIPNMIVELLDYLNIDELAVQGVSGGGPFALACSKVLSARIFVCNAISTMTPYTYGTDEMVKENRTVLFLARRLPWLLYIFLKLQSGMMKDRERIMTQIYKQKHRLPQKDAMLLDDPEYVDIFVESMIEGAKQGSKGLIQEFKLLTRDWGFQPCDISSTIPVHLWHGHQDKNVPITLVERMSFELKNASTHFFADEGHSVVYHHCKDIFEVIQSNHI